MTTPSPTPILELRDVTKSYDSAPGTPPTQVLDGISLTVTARTSTAVIGPSGCGKSTLLNLIGALDTPTSGAILLNGRDLATLDEKALATIRNNEIGFIFQQHHLLPQCTALENVLVPMLAERSAVPADMVSRARALLDRVGLAGRIDHRPGKLSGGECQRVAVVRALIHRPSLILADEPTGLLDPAHAGGMIDLLEELRREEGTTLIMVTHAHDLAARMERTLAIAAGRLTSDRTSAASPAANFN